MIITNDSDIHSS